MLRPNVMVKECRHGRMAYLPHDIYVGRSLEFYGEFSELEGEIFPQLVGAGHVVAEVGANIGAHTVPLAKLVGPTGIVLAFEPQRAMFYLLCANVALNEQFHVLTHRAAVGSSAGLTTVPLHDHRSELNFGGVALTDPGAREEVALAALDQFTLPSLRLLKIDVEGMESEVLLGARQTIATHRPILYMENDRRDNSERLISMTIDLGYDLYWHFPPLYNPGNFAGRVENIFDRIISINLLGIPQEMEKQVNGLRRVSGPTDWWQDQR
jgi:FkbM family methyltransferase